MAAGNRAPTWDHSRNRQYIILRTDAISSRPRQTDPFWKKEMIVKEIAVKVVTKESNLPEGELVR